MKRNFYGKKMFIADLIIVTIWAFFVLRLSLWYICPAWLFIAMRIALCFEMQRKSPWVLYSAVTFLLCSSGFIFEDNIYMGYYPFKRLAYYIGAWVGDGKAVVDTFNAELTPEVSIWLTFFGTILIFWLIGVPIVIGVLQKTFSSIKWRRKWIIVYLTISAILAILIGVASIGRPFAGAFMFGLFLSFLPIIYWMKYERNGRSAISLMVGYKPLVLYVSTVLMLTLCLYIGIDRWDSIKASALVILPPVFYLIICRWCNLKPLTRHAVAISICGGLFYYILNAPESVKIVTLSVSVGLALYVAIDLIRRDKNTGAGIMIFLMPTVVVCPLILGLNPYVLLEMDSIEHYYHSYSAGDGVFVICKDGKYGLRDRFGLVLEPEYDRFDRLDRWGRFVSTNVGDGSFTADNRYGVFDIEKREFLLDPQRVVVSQLSQAGVLTYHLIAPDGKHFADLQLAGYHPEMDGYVHHTYIEYYDKASGQRDDAIPCNVSQQRGGENDRMEDSESRADFGTSKPHDYQLPEELLSFSTIIDSLRNRFDTPVSLEYTLLNLTGGNRPEVWIRIGTCEAAKMLYVYAMVNNQPTLILEEEGGHSDLFESDGKIINVVCNCGGGYVVTYEYKNGNMIISKPIEFSVFNDEQRPKAIIKHQDEQLQAILSQCIDSVTFHNVI